MILINVFVLKKMKRKINMKKYLFIHPKDETTDFLSAIYNVVREDIKTVVRDCSISNSKLVKLIQSHENVIILGHGNEFGLLCSTSNHERFNRLLINSRHVEFLRKCKSVIGIWCDSDKFFEKYSINGFASGMFVSDLDEANDFALPLSITDIEESNKLLATLLSQSFYCDSKFIYNYLYDGFKKLSKNKIAQFNCQNFRLFDYF